MSTMLPIDRNLSILDNFIALLNYSNPNLEVPLVKEDLDITISSVDDSKGITSYTLTPSTIGSKKYLGSNRGQYFRLPLPILNGTKLTGNEDYPIIGLPNIDEITLGTLASIHLPFDDPDGVTSYRNRGTQEITMTKSGSIYTTASNHYFRNRSCYFDGGDYSLIKLKTDQKLVFENDFTISMRMWIQSHPTRFGKVLATSGRGWGGGSELFVRGTGGYSATVTFNNRYPGNNHTGYKSISSSKNAPVEEWLTLTLMRKSGVMYLYFNDEKVAEKEWTERVDIDSVSGYTTIGNCDWERFPGFKGYIEDFRVFPEIAIDPVHIHQRKHALGNIEYIFDGDLKEYFTERLRIHGGDVFNIYALDHRKSPEDKLYTEVMVRLTNLDEPNHCYVGECRAYISEGTEVVGAYASETEIDLLPPDLLNIPDIPRSTYNIIGTLELKPWNIEDGILNNWKLELSSYPYTTLYQETDSTVPGFDISNITISNIAKRATFDSSQDDSAVPGFDISNITISNIARQLTVDFTKDDSTVPSFDFGENINIRNIKREMGTEETDSSDVGFDISDITISSAIVSNRHEELETTTATFDISDIVIAREN